MDTPKSKWDMERAAAWLLQRGWGEGRPAEAPTAAVAPPAGAEVAPDAAVNIGVNATVSAGAISAPDVAANMAEPPEEIDVAGWPALVAPFYD